MLRHRFTPTHVGNTRPQSGATARPPVHPHACGEHGVAGGRTARRVGSPPRMWGTLLQQNGSRPWARFTPTHVGNTSPTYKLQVLNTVHPHACGEHVLRLTETECTTGSPPRMWGTLKFDRVGGRHRRFTPTHVGNTRRLCTGWCRRPVHPHACGEHQWWAADSDGYGGSPPRMWGTPHYWRTYNTTCRFTPTHVGNTVAFGSR